MVTKTEFHTVNRPQRWVLQLSYNFKFEYVKISEFGHVDALSRLIDNQLRPEKDYVIASVQLETDLTFILNDSLQISSVTFKQIQEATQKDSLLQEVIQFNRLIIKKKILRALKSLN